MKYLVTLRDKTYEVEVEHGEAMILDEYLAQAPAAPARAEEAVAAPHVAPVAEPAVVSGGTVVAAPLPGQILTIQATVGHAVHAGDVLIVIEAMKMENDVVAPCDGVVRQVMVSKGQNVATGDTLVVI